jgi:anti-sigma-K factor RskA
MTDKRENRTLLAAEYVLGMLPDERRRAVERLANRDPALAEEIAGWQQEFEPLAELDSPRPPAAHLWDRIEATLEDRVVHAPPSRRSEARDWATSLARRLSFWRAGAIGAGVVAVCAALLLWRGEATMPIAVGLMLPQGTTGEAVRVAVTASDRIYVSPRSTLPVPPGRRLDLWAKPLEAKAPQLLGEIPATGGALRFAGLPSDVTTVMITSDLATPGAATIPGRTLFLGVLAATRF